MGVRKETEKEEVRGDLQQVCSSAWDEPRLEEKEQKKKTRRREKRRSLWHNTKERKRSVTFRSPSN